MAASAVRRLIDHDGGVAALGLLVGQLRDRMSTLPCGSSNLQAAAEVRLVVISDYEGVEDECCAGVVTGLGHDAVLDLVTRTRMKGEPMRTRASSCLLK